MMITIKRKNREPLIIEEASTVKEAVEYAARKRISLKGADLRGSDLTGADLSYADLSYADLSHAKLPGADLRYIYLSGADLSDTDLRAADLTGANLPGANLTGTNLYFSCLPLWCGSLDMKIDKRIFCQLLYHTLRAGKTVEDKEVAEFLNDPKAIALANQFHRADECGIIKQGEKTE